jgi:antitoxin ChpS
MSRVDLLAPPDDAAVTRAVTALASALREHYGDRLKAIYLFGSRARGDFEPYSDVDVALILEGEVQRSLPETRYLSDLAYDLLLETGAEVQPWPIEEKDWRNPDNAESPALVGAMKRDAKPIWVAS